MSTLQLSIVCLTAVFLAAIAFNGQQNRSKGRQTLLDDLANRSTDVVLHIGDGQSVRGAVLDLDDEGVVVAGATLRALDGTEARLAGAVWLPRGSLALMQEVPLRAVPESNGKAQLPA